MDSVIFNQLANKLNYDVVYLINEELKRLIEEEQRSLVEFYKDQVHDELKEATGSLFERLNEYSDFAIDFEYRARDKDDYYAIIHELDADGGWYITVA